MLTPLSVISSRNGLCVRLFVFGLASFSTISVYCAHGELWKSLKYELCLVVSLQFGPVPVSMAGFIDVKKMLCERRRRL